ncbi:MAG: hypothetical protein ABIA47_04800 [bacterium]
MPHYICTGGCEGVSDAPGVCQTTDCDNYVEELEECDCNDDEHFGAFAVGIEDIEEAAEDVENVEVEPEQEAEFDL